MAAHETKGSNMPQMFMLLVAIASLVWLLGHGDFKKGFIRFMYFQWILLGLLFVAILLSLKNLGNQKSIF